ncbi:signal peptidase I [Paenibacillus sp. IB182496]|uniref:Signal peptidase I n=1 Tax=Paenibacillus sabuli TaxID=2772509 RepID=A0A927BZA9_9BACL|nr:signal peptidase I [Paenibacillus sabuli]MBD2848495.1 signal peptidase I [Paenibacillus sabuli]
MNRREWEHRLQTGPFRERTFTYRHMRRIAERLASGPPRSKIRLPAYIGPADAVFLLLGLLGFAPALLREYAPVAPAAITDADTPVELPLLRPVGNQFAFDPMYDNMDQGRKVLMEGALVDPDYYRSHALRRGDIVYYDGSLLSDRLQQQELSRVVGLPGETISIRDGQLYVDGMRLDTFYGSARWGGMDREAFLALSDSPNLNKANILEATYGFTLEAITLPPDAVFLVGDNWLLSLDSRYLGPVPVEHIHGKVVGRAASK